MAALLHLTPRMIQRMWVFDVLGRIEHGVFS